MFHRVDNHSIPTLGHTRRRSFKGYARIVFFLTGVVTLLAIAVAAAHVQGAFDGLYSSVGQTELSRVDTEFVAPKLPDLSGVQLRGLPTTLAAAGASSSLALPPEQKRSVQPSQALHVLAQQRAARYEQKILRHKRLRALLDALDDSGLDVPAKAHTLVPSFEVASTGLTKPMPLVVHKPSVTRNGGRDFALDGYLRQIDRQFARISSSQSTQRQHALMTIDQALDRWDDRQLASLHALAEALSVEIERLASVPRALGVEPQLAKLPRSDETGLGGPFVPLLTGATTDDPFENKLDQIELAVLQITELGSLLRQLPIRHPLGDATPISSRFGPRRDPFTGRLAMHQGIDFRGKRGTPVTATGGGTIRKAGRNAGYGKMVIIDHGNGFTTRYAHLHRISVSVGDTIKPGEKIGTVGSTGRSTGPHLHYEVRRDGKARNPISFLSVGATL